MQNDPSFDPMQMKYRPNPELPPHYGSFEDVISNPIPIHQQPNSPVLHALSDPGMLRHHYLGKPRKF